MPKKVVPIEERGAALECLKMQEWQRVLLEVDITTITRLGQLRQAYHII